MHLFVVFFLFLLILILGLFFKSWITIKQLQPFSMTSDVPSPQHHYCSLSCLGEHHFWFHQLTTDQKYLSFMLHKNI